MNSLQVRLIDYALSVMLITDKTKKNPVLHRISDQLNRSSSSVGANYAEAQSATSSKDFHHKIRIALKEARESEYWLELLRRRTHDPDFIDKTLSEPSLKPLK